jgi:tetratricopeptide (TPR) repeat protein
MSIHSRISRVFTLLLFSFCCGYISLAFSSESGIEPNCTKPKTNPPSKNQPTRNPSKELTVIQTVESCPKNQLPSNTSGIELIEKSARFALDGAAESTKKSAEFSVKTLETIKNFIVWMGGFLTFLIALAAGLGWKSISDLKTDITKLSRKHISAERVRFKNQTALVTADFNAKTDASLKQFESLKESLLKTLEVAAFTRNFFLTFTVAKNESMQCEHPTLKAEFMGSALFNYQRLVKDIDLVNKAELSEFVNSHLNMRKEIWDNEISDDAIFMKCWMYQDIAYLQKRLGRLDDAINTCKEGLKICPNAWSIVFNLSCYQCLKELDEEAKRSLEQCLSTPYAGTFANWALNDDDFVAFLKRQKSMNARLLALTE